MTAWPERKAGDKHPSVLETDAMAPSAKKMGDRTWWSGVVEDDEADDDDDGDDDDDDEDEDEDEDEDGDYDDDDADGDDWSWLIMMPGA